MVEWLSRSFGTQTHILLLYYKDLLSILDEHLVKTQAMRGSPYFKPFESEVLGWESQLIRIKDFFTHILIIFC